MENLVAYKVKTGNNCFQKVSKKKQIVEFYRQQRFCKCDKSNVSCHQYNKSKFYPKYNRLLNYFRYNNKAFYDAK